MLDEAKVGPPDWDRKDDEFIETAKYEIQQLIPSVLFQVSD